MHVLLAKVRDLAVVEKNMDLCHMTHNDPTHRDFSNLELYSTKCMQLMQVLQLLKS